MPICKLYLEMSNKMNNIIQFYYIIKINRCVTRKNYKHFHRSDYNIHTLIIVTFILYNMSGIFISIYLYLAIHNL